MTDFLTRLIGRNLGQWPVVQPQITSLYAPGSTLAGLDERPEETAPGMAPPPPVSATDAPLGNPTPPFAPTASAPALESPPSIPKLFVSGDRPTLPLTRLPRPPAPLPAGQPPPLDSVTPTQQAPAPGSAPAFPAAVPLSDSIERPDLPLEPATPATNLPVENFEPTVPRVGLSPNPSDDSPTAMSQAVAPSPARLAAQPVAATSSAEHAIAPNPLSQSTPPPQPAAAIPGASTPLVPLGSADTTQPPSAQPAPPGAAQSRFSNGSEAMAMGQSASASPPVVRPLGLPSQESATATDHSPESATPGESRPPVVAPLLPTVAPALVVPAPVNPVPQALRQGGPAAAPAVPTIQEPTLVADRLQGSAAPGESFPPAVAPLLPTVALALVVPAAVDPAPQALRQGGAGSTAVPTIHVTIGRIDVRAITPPSPPPSRARRTPAAPQLSLNDYLTSRNQTP